MSDDRELEPQHPSTAISGRPDLRAPVVPMQPLRRLEKRGRVWRWAGIALAIAVVAGVAFVLFRPTTSAVELGTVTRGSVHVSVAAEGQTRILRRHVLVAPVTGVLARIALRAGDSVSSGSAVAQLTATTSAMLDPRSRELAEQRLGSAMASLAQLRANASRARLARDQTLRELERSRRLEAAGAIPPQQLEQLATAAAERDADVAAALSGVRMAEHEVAAAQAARRNFTAGSGAGEILIRSPMTGVVLRVLQEDEGVAAAGTPLLEIGDPSSIEVVTDVLSEDAARLKAGARARIVVAGGDTIPGSVRQIEPKAFTKRSSLGVDEQRVRVILDVAAQRATGAPLGDGYRVDVAIDQGTSTADAVVVPAGALVRHSDAWAVYVYRDGKAVLAPVTIGLRNDAQVEIRKGLTVGDRVILFPSDAISDGSRVQQRRTD